MGLSTRWPLSPVFTKPIDNSGQQLATYLLRPEIIFDRLWALPDRTMHALGDAENS